MESKDHWTGVFSVSVLLEDRDNHKECIISSVYGPNVNHRRMEFWNELDTIRMRWSKPWCIGGDFNVIKFSEDKLGGSRITPEMSAFSDWISRHGLLDLQLNGASFTWSNHQTWSNYVPVG